MAEFLGKGDDGSGPEDSEEVGRFASDWTCVECRRFVRRPVLTKCGHRLCEDCVPSRPGPCPVGGDRCEMVSSRSVVPDCMGRRRELDRASEKEETNRRQTSFRSGREVREHRREGPRGSMDAHGEFLLTRCLRLERDNDRLKVELARVSRECREHRKGLEEKLRRSKMARLDLELRIRMLECASYDGTLLWSIQGYARRKVDALSGKIPSIHSQYFYAGRRGYKMCAKAYLAGTREGRGTHLSLYFVVMRGEFDALLPWPFDRKVVLEVVDQEGNQHLRGEFRPGQAPSSDAFCRPDTEINAATGFPRFAASRLLEAADAAYVKEDQLFVRVTVDMEGLDLP